MGYSGNSYAAPAQPNPKKPSGGVKSLSELMGLVSSPERDAAPPPRDTRAVGSYVPHGQHQLYSPPREPSYPPLPPAHSNFAHEDNVRYSGVGMNGGTQADVHAGELSNVREKMNNYINGGVEEVHRRSGVMSEEAPVLSPLEQQAREVSNQLYARHDKNVVNTVMRDVIQRDLGVTFDDIAAVPVAKRLLHEAVILPLIMPEFFTGIREPWKVRK